MSEDAEYKGPQFVSHCPHPTCLQTYYAYTQNGANALMAMHLDDHKRGFVKGSSPLSESDKDFLKKALIRWED
jgi:hypothetical protein